MSALPILLEGGIQLRSCCLPRSLFPKEVDLVDGWGQRALAAASRLSDDSPYHLCLVQCSRCCEEMVR